ncbi:MAG: S-layer homology domain-containing protein [Clostridia bacterium]|nr:S-layer homology domain-containing protein [Clostridia bacterium]
MTFRSLFKILTAGVVLTALTLTACADFPKKNTYNGQFTDVAETAWYKNEVASAYELGFVKGTSDTLYSPNNTVTVAEAVTMASRVHAEYNDKTISEKTGGKWYDAYVEYAKKNGIITENQFDDYNREIKRFEMAEIFHDAMGEKYYKAINDVVFIPDVPIGAYYWDKLITLYNAGVVMGNDEYGSFNPDSLIKRSECAAIINRVAIPENRLKKELSDFTSDDAYVLCYNVSMGGSKEGINSGWVFDNRGGTAKTDNTGATAIGDVSDKYGTCYIREFNYIPKGKVVLETQISAADDGAYLEYLDIEGKPVYQLKIVNGEWNILRPEGYISTGVDGGFTIVRAIIDLDSGKADTYINNIYCSKTDLLSDNIFSYRVGMDEKGIGTVSVAQVNMVVNYAEYENFDIFDADTVFGWEKTGSVKRTNNQLDFSSGATLSKEFETPLSGKVCTEVYLISKDGKDFEIKLGDSLTIGTVGKKLVANSKELYNLPQNMWHRLRIEEDTVNGNADILLNGRSVGNVTLSSKSAIDSMEFSAKGLFSIDNLHIFNLYDHADYVPEPTTRANLDDYIVGLNICSLWRNGTHYGWACISAHDEPIPVIGMYDEGNPESADWEIKYMVEHGIDFQAFCWYADQNMVPLKYPSNSEQLHHGYMYGEYSDYMKYCILWEAANAAHFNSFYFRNHVVPYWFENYFLDPRYMTIDNKLVLPIFGSWQLATDEYFGTVEGVKKEFDYLENKAKEYGFDGVLFFATGSSTDQLANMGFDGAYAYNWGTAGKDYQHNVNSITNSAKNQRMYTIPTISVGFDSIPWHGIRYGNMTTDDFAKAQEWVKNEYLPKYSPKYDWAENFMWLSTWNEYGEGTYIMPSGLNGFGYVDVVRNAYTDLPEDHEDIVPSLKQKERITHLYPQYAKLLRRDGWYYYDRDEAVAEAELTNKLYVNDVDILANCNEEFAIPPMKQDGRILYPFNPSTGVNFILGTHYEYRKDAGTLKIMANGHEVFFKVGYDRYRLDGVEYDLGYTPVIFDGLVMLDFEKLARDLGYKTETKNGDVYIFTDTYEKLWKVLKDRKTGIWEFNNDYDNEGYSSSHMTLVTKDGALKMTTITETNDPISFFAHGMFPTDFYAKKFTSLEVRCRYKYTTASGNPSNLSFYYITDLDSTYDENKNLRLNFNDLDSKGEWVTLKMNLLDQNNWQSADRIMGLRFDPFNGQGEIEIDYIRFIEDPDFVYVPIEERPIEIINGDAEGDMNPYHSGNAKIRRIVDPDNKDNHVWFVETASGKQWTYIRHTTRFKPYTAYKIDYDIKLVGSNKTGGGGPTETSFNTNFRYADKGAFNDFDHVVPSTSNSSISVSDGWKHCSATFSTGKIDNHENSEFSIYTNPNGEYGFSYYVDNIVVTEIDGYEVKVPLSETFDWAKAKGKTILDFESADEEYYVGAASEKNVQDGNLFVKVEAPNTDIQIGMDVFFDAKEYKAIAVRFKANKTEAENPFSPVFFATESDPELSESKSAKCSYSGLKADGDGYMTAVFELSENDRWKGKVAKLRFDPANSAGEYIIDKVFLVEK